MFPWPLPPIATYLLTRRYLKWPLAPIRPSFSLELKKVLHKNSINLSAVYDASKTLGNTSDYDASVLHEFFQSQPTALQYHKFSSVAPTFRTPPRCEISDASASTAPSVRLEQRRRCTVVSPGQCDASASTAPSVSLEQLHRFTMMSFDGYTSTFRSEQ